jgi:hypothetical protein
MGVFDEAPPPTGGSRIGRKLILLAGVIVAGAAAWMTWTREEPVAPPPAHTAKPAASAARPRADASRPSPAASAPEPVASDAEPSASTPAPEASKPAGVLRVRSDVPGASVFLDRKFLGTTPLDVDGLDPGQHRLNVSVEGYEGHAQSVAIGATPAEVDVRFKEVRLDASIPVVHKHAMGSCSGRLIADTSGLRYETANSEDAFTIGFGELDTFVVDYLKKTLRVKKRGGRTWNFEDPKGQADNLFVFHRDVEKARARLASN